MPVLTRKVEEHLRATVNDFHLKNLRKLVERTQKIEKENQVKHRQIVKEE